MTPTCTYEGCTFDTTGICVIGNDPDDCPNRNHDAAMMGDTPNGEAEATPRLEDGGDAAAGAAMPPLVAPPKTRTTLPIGRQLGFDDLERIGSQNGYRMIAVLGAPDAGKTAALVSLYLLAANHKLEDLRFRNSASIFGFDEIAGGAARWDDNGEMLEKITEHTQLADPRRPGFLHLRLFSGALGEAVDLVFPDLPGEWTDSLVEKSDYERLKFIGSAQAIWVFVDGSALVDPEQRQITVNRAQLILARVRQYFDPRPTVPVILAVSRRDKMNEIPQGQIDRIIEEAEKREIDLKVVPIASFSKSDDIAPGFGIEQLLSCSLTRPASAPAVEVTQPRSWASRQMLRFRSNS